MTAAHLVSAPCRYFPDATWGKHPKGNICSFEARESASSANQPVLPTGLTCDRNGTRLYWRGELLIDGTVKPTALGTRAMIQPSKRLQEFECRYTRETVAKLTYADALAIFQALWVEASELNPDFPGPWRSDIGPDLAIARALNGLPPSP